MLRASILLALLAMSGCASTPPLPPVPTAECEAISDLILSLDDPDRLSKLPPNTDAPSTFPAHAQVTPVAGFNKDEADLASCTALMDTISKHRDGSGGYAHYLFQRPRVSFGRVKFNADATEAHVAYLVAYGPLNSESWGLTLARGANGRWEISASRLLIIS
ncbi:MAG TPA: hypothetical protein VHL34_21270 [Rhizomicrobium sp.]|jgi:hypothetical protein|nr:hypothetical protein [Rhizomicrobium sp.]